MRANTYRVAVVVAAPLLCSPLAAQEEGQIAALKSNTKPSSVHLIQFAGKELKGRAGTESYYRQVEVAPAHRPDLPRTLTEIGKAYESKKNNNDIGLTILQFNHALIKAAIGVKPSLGGETGAGAAWLSGLGYLASKGLDRVENMYKDAARTEIRRNLKTQLETYRTKAGDADYKKLVTQNDVAGFRSELERRVGPIFGDVLGNIPAEDRDIVNAFYSKEIATLMKDGFSVLANEQQLQATDIERNRQNIIGLSRTFAKFAERTQEQLGHIIETQGQIQAGLDDLNKRVGRTEQGVEFLQQYMFGKMTPDEQLNALRSGIFPGMPDGQRKDLEERIALVKKREELTKSISSYLNGANELVSIARNLGVDPEIVGKAQLVVNAGTQVFNAFGAFASMNFLGGVSALTSIFGLGGRDIAAERHQEIMSALTTLYSKVDVIDRKIDLLLQGQEQILKNQQTIFNAVVHLSEQVASNHREVLERLREVQGDILYNRVLINTRVDEEYALCRNLVIHPITGERRIDTSRRLYPRYAEFLALHRDFGDQFSTCATRLQRTRMANDEFHSTFWLETYKQIDNNVGVYIDTIYAAALALLEGDVGATAPTAAQRFSSLLSPMHTVSDLDRKIATVGNPRQPRFRRPFDVLMRRAIAPSAVARHSNYLLDIHFYYQLVNPATNRPFPFASVITPAQIRKTGYFALFEALNLVDIAVAQQTLLSGDVLLPIMYGVWRNQARTPSPEDERQFLLLKRLMRGNSIVARNFTLYALRHEVLAESNALTYSVALGGSDPALLKSITTSAWDFQWSKDEVRDGDIVTRPRGWSIKVENQYQSLPTAEELSHGVLSYQPDLYPLLDLRARIAEEIASYELFGAIPPQRRLRFNEVILNGI